MAEENDILLDLQNRLKEIGFKDPKIEKVVMEVRQDWHGERPYISVKYEADKKRSERNAFILRDIQRGESISLLMRRYGLSRTRLYEIKKNGFQS